MIFFVRKATEFRRHKHSEINTAAEYVNASRKSGEHTLRNVRFPPGLGTEGWVAGRLEEARQSEESGFRGKWKYEKWSKTREKATAPDHLWVKVEPAQLCWATLLESSGVSKSENICSQWASKGLPVVERLETAWMGYFNVLYCSWRLNNKVRVNITFYCSQLITIKTLDW